MPVQVKAQSIGRTGERWFAAVLPSTWILQPPLDDVGVDGVVVICEDGPLNGLEFRVQIKTSERWTMTGDAILVRSVNRESLRYWVTGFTPTLLVLHEVSTGRGVCAWANQLLARQQQHLSTGGKTVSLLVDQRLEINPQLWPKLGQQLRTLSGAIARRIVSAGMALPLLRTVHTLAEALRGIDFATNSTRDDGLPPDDSGLLLQLEVSCHRDVVRSVRTLSAAFDDSGRGIEGLEEFAAEYSAKCGSFITRFDEIVADPDRLRQLQVNVAEMVARRQGFIRSIVDVIRQLTAIGLQVVPRVSQRPSETEGECRLTTEWSRRASCPV